MRLREWRVLHSPHPLILFGEAGRATQGTFCLSRCGTSLPFGGGRPASRIPISQMSPGEVSQKTAEEPGVRSTELPKPSPSVTRVVTRGTDPKPQKSLTVRLASEGGQGVEGRHPECLFVSGGRPGDLQDPGERGGQRKAPQAGGGRAGGTAWALTAQASQPPRPPPSPPPPLRGASLERAPPPLNAPHNRPTAQAPRGPRPRARATAGSRVGAA